LELIYVLGQIIYANSQDKMETKHKDIWGKLSKIDCTDQIDKKMGLKYLSWAWAWGIAMENYPDTEFDVKYFSDPSNATKMYPYEILPDGTATVWVEVIIENVRRLMWLPVMDNRNNPIKNPNSRQVSDTTMRCLVKCLALFGLGHYIYAGEDLPDTAPEEPQESRTTAHVTPQKVSPPAWVVSCQLRFGTKEDKVNKYCIGKGYIKQGQTFRDLKDNERQLLINNIEAVCKTLGI